MNGQLAPRALPASAFEWDDDDRRYALLAADEFTLAYAVVELSGITAILDDLVPRGVGRPRDGLSDIDVLAACIAVPLAGDAPHFRAMAKWLHAKMPKEQRVARGITRPWPAPTETGKPMRQKRRAAEEAVRRRFERIAAALDPYLSLGGSPRPLVDLIADVRRHLEGEHWYDDVKARRRNLVRSMNAIIQGSVALTPASLLKQAGSILAVDGTFGPTWARGPRGHAPVQRIIRELLADPRVSDAKLLRRLRRNSNALASADVGSGWYVREEADGRKEVKGFGLELTTAHTGDATGVVNEITFPSLTLGAVIDACAVDPGGNAIALLSEVREWGHRVGLNFNIGVFDALYPGLDIGFRRELRHLGLMPVFRLRSDQLGKSGESYEGVQWTEGRPYCMFMPKHLVDAHKDYEAGRISADERDRRISDRRAWEFRSITGTDTLDEHGAPISHRYACPTAYRQGLEYTCARRSGAKPGAVTLKVKKPQSGEQLPMACRQTSITIDYSLGVAARQQAFPYGSPEWTAVNARNRSMNEGRNGTSKQPDKVAIGTKGIRRVNGLAANGLLAACQLAATNILALRNFLRESTPSDNGVLLRRYSPYRTVRARKKPQATSTAAVSTRRRSTAKAPRQPSQQARRTASARAPAAPPH